MPWVPEGTFIGTAGPWSAYTHTTCAMGGYWSASFTVGGKTADVEAWLDEGLARHVVVKDDAQQTVWEGFVNVVEASLGGLSVTRGPLLDVVNAAAVVYLPVTDPTTSPPTLGNRTVTAYAYNADSATKYPLLAKVYSGGSLLPAEATQARDLIVGDLGEPVTSKQWSSDARSAPSVRVSCLGYVHWLAAFQYSQVALSNVYDLSAKVADILDADPNGVFSSANADIATNATQVLRYDDSQRSGWDLLKKACSLGDAALNRYVVSVGNGRRVRYEAVGDDVAYLQRLADPNQEITTPTGTMIYPWEVRAGRWLFFTDFLAGRVPATTPVRKDPRMLFLESITYTAPNSLMLTGSRVSRLDQAIARWGLSGMG